MLNFNQLQGCNCRTYQSGIVSPHSSWIFLRSVSFAPILRRKSPQGQKNKTASPTDSMYGRFHGTCMQIYSSSNTSYGPLESLQKCCNKKLWITFSCIYWNFAIFSYFQLFFPTCLTATLVSAPWVIIWQSHRGWLVSRLPRNPKTVKHFHIPGWPNVITPKKTKKCMP